MNNNLIFYCSSVFKYNFLEEKKYENLKKLCAWAVHKDCASGKREGQLLEISRLIQRSTDLDEVNRQSQKASHIVYGINLNQSHARRLRPLYPNIHVLSYAEQLDCFKTVLHQVSESLKACNHSNTGVSSNKVALHCFSRWCKFSKLLKIVADIEDELRIRHRAFPQKRELSKRALVHRDKFIARLVQFLTLRRNPGHRVPNTEIMSFGKEEEETIPSRTKQCHLLYALVNFDKSTPSVVRKS